MSFPWADKPAPPDIPSSIWTGDCLLCYPILMKLLDRVSDSLDFRSKHYIAWLPSTLDVIGTIVFAFFVCFALAFPFWAHADVTSATLPDGTSITNLDTSFQVYNYVEDYNTQTPSSVIYSCPDAGLGSDYWYHINFLDVTQNFAISTLANDDFNDSAASPWITSDSLHNFFDGSTLSGLGVFDGDTLKVDVEYFQSDNSTFCSAQDIGTTFTYHYVVPPPVPFDISCSTFGTGTSTECVTYHDWLYMNLWILFCVSFLPIGVIFSLWKHGSLKDMNL